MRVAVRRQVKQMRLAALTHIVMRGNSWDVYRSERLFVNGCPPATPPNRSPLRLVSDSARLHQASVRFHSARIGDIPVVVRYKIAVVHVGLDAQPSEESGLAAPSPYCGVSTLRRGATCAKRGRRSRAQPGLQPSSGADRRLGSYGSCLQGSGGSPLGVLDPGGVEARRACWRAISSFMTWRRRSRASITFGCRKE